MTNIVPLVKLPSKSEAERIIRQLVEQDKIQFSKHARRRKAQRGITTVQIINCLKTGRVIDNPVASLTYKGWETTVRGKVAGENLKVALCLRWSQDILVITAYYET